LVPGHRIRPHPEIIEMIKDDNPVIRGGIAIVPKNAIILDGTTI